jgi:hypothetical protein
MLLASRIGSPGVRLCGNMMGNRVDLSARTFITGDPNYELVEVGGPRRIAVAPPYPKRGESVLELFMSPAHFCVRSCHTTSYFTGVCFKRAVKLSRSEIYHS